jgi:opacity protein-like surface antigen
MKHYLYFTFLCVVALLSNKIQAQVFPYRAVSFGINHNLATNGFNMSYHWENKQWVFAAGPRIMFNTYRWNDNKRLYLNYQTGFAASFWEFIGLQSQINKSILQKNKFKAGLNLNVLLTNNSLKVKNSDRFLQRAIVDSSVDFYKSGLAFELTLGPYIQYQISKKLSAYAMAGFGWYCSNRSQLGIDLLTNEPVIATSLTGGNPFKELIGFDGLPTLQVALKYRL